MQLHLSLSDLTIITFIIIRNHLSDLILIDLIGDLIYDPVCNILFHQKTAMQCTVSNNCCFQKFF